MLHNRIHTNPDPSRFQSLEVVHQRSQNPIITWVQWTDSYSSFVPVPLPSNKLDMPNYFFCQTATTGLSGRSGRQNLTNARREANASDVLHLA